MCTAVKSKVKILQNFVAFSEYMNFKSDWTNQQYGMKINKRTSWNLKCQMDLKSATMIGK